MLKHSLCHWKLQTEQQSHVSYRASSCSRYGPWWLYRRKWVVLLTINSSSFLKCQKTNKHDKYGSGWSVKGWAWLGDFTLGICPNGKSKLLAFSAFCLYISHLAQYQNQIYTPTYEETNEEAQEASSRGRAISYSLNTMKNQVYSINNYNNKAYLVIYTNMHEYTQRK